MNEVASCIFEIGKTKGRNAKIDVVKKHADVPGFKEILQFIYDPFIRTGIGIAKLKKVRIGNNVVSTITTWEGLLEYLKLHSTGRDQDVVTVKHFIKAQTTDEAIMLAEAIATKDLKIGVNAKTFNTIFGEDFIPLFGIMKAEKYKDFKNKVEGPFIVTEKLDGARRILVKQDGVVTLYTRSGHVDTGLVDIENEAKHLPNNFVLDGELLAIGEFETSIALRQATNAIANSKGERSGVKFHVFDGMPLEEFKRGKSSDGAFKRKIFLAMLFGDESLQVLKANWEYLISRFKLGYNFKHITTVPIIGVAHNEEQVIEFARPIWERKFEGVMLNTFHGVYDLTVDRSRDILKVKNVEELTLKIVDFLPGEGEFEGTLGALVVDYKGYRVGVGSGLTLAQRRTVWAAPQLFVGKKIEIDTFGESSNKDGGISLNSPIFKRFVGEEE